LATLAEEANEFANEIRNHGPKSGEKTDDDGCSFGSHTIRNFLARLGDMVFRAEAAFAGGAIASLPCWTDIQAGALNA